MDPLTKKIIGVLRRDGRASYSDIARELSTTRDSVAARVNPLFNSGELRVIAAPHPRVLGLTVTAHLSVKVRGNAMRVVEQLEKLESLVLITVVVGAFQIVAETDVRDMAELQQQVSMIRTTENITEVQVLIYERVLSSFFMGPAPASDRLDFDELDIAIIRRLQHNGRASYADLADHVGLSLSGCRVRLQRLLETGVVQIGAIPRRTEDTLDLVFGIGINIRGEPDTAVQTLKAAPGLEFIASTVGRFDLVATVSFTSLREFNQLIASILRLPQVSYCEQWLHAQLVRERYEHTLENLRVVTGGPATAAP
jgi:DNA-binding Lrp family transcriptional regulator